MMEISAADNITECARFERAENPPVESILPKVHHEQDADLSVVAELPLLEDDALGSRTVTSETIGVRKCGRKTKVSLYKFTRIVLYYCVP